MEARVLREIRELLDTAEHRQVLKAGATELRPNNLEDGERLVLPAGADRDLPRLLFALDVELRAATTA